MSNNQYGAQTWAKDVPATGAMTTETLHMHHDIEAGPQHHPWVIEWIKRAKSTYVDNDDLALAADEISRHWVEVAPRASAKRKHKGKSKRMRFNPGTVGVAFMIRRKVVEAYKAFIQEDEEAYEKLPSNFEINLYRVLAGELSSVMVNRIIEMGAHELLASPKAVQTRRMKGEATTRDVTARQVLPAKESNEQVTKQEATDGERSRVHDELKKFL